jgi:hypothetical protein
MARFYETTFLDSPEAQRLLGWEVLASPSEINGEPIVYEELLRDLGESVSVGDVGGLGAALALVGDPTSEWNAGRRKKVISPSVPPELPAGYLEALIASPFFAAETSPLGQKSIGALDALASSTVIVMIGGRPALVFVGARLGLVVIRGLNAVGGAIWDGARPEIVELSGDTTAVLLAALRRRLGIPRRKRRG